MASKRLLSAKSEEGDELSVDMSPMIDLVFLLLIFFLVTATMIIVKQDPNVEPPVASHSQRAKDGNGRIVINIYEDGTFTNEDQKKLETDQDIIDLVKEEKGKIENMGYKPKLHLRGHKEAVFKHCRKVIKLSAGAGVDQVLFATYGFQN